MDYGTIAFLVMVAIGGFIIARQKQLIDYLCRVQSSGVIRGSEPLFKVPVCEIEKALTLYRTEGLQESGVYWAEKCEKILAATKELYCICRSIESSSGLLVRPNKILVDVDAYMEMQRALGNYEQSRIVKS